MKNNDREKIGFFALWDSKRSEYHASEEEEITTCLNIGNAFDSARENGAKIFGHYYCRWGAERKTFTFWRCPDFHVLEKAMDNLEKAGDFKFAESEHRVGIEVLNSSQSDDSISSFEDGTRELPFAFVAFWKWKDSYFRATQEEKANYSENVDKVFMQAKSKGIHTLGKYHCTFSSKWDYFTFWLSPSFEALEEIIDSLEIAGDFKFAESRHLIGYLESGNRFGIKLQTLDY